MGKRLTVVAGSLAALVVGSVLAFASPAHAATTGSGTAIPVTCTVVPLVNGLEITLCV